MAMTTGVIGATRTPPVRRILLRFDRWNWLGKIFPGFVRIFSEIFIDGIPAAMRSLAGNEMDDV
jgi:hypothetical protein